MMRVEPVTLSTVRAFARLDNESLQRIAPSFNAHNLAAGQTVLRVDEPSHDVYFIITGTVTARVFSVSGRQVSFRELGAGELFGDLSALDGAPRCANVETRTDCLLASTRAATFRDLMRRYPAIADVVMEDLAKLVRQLSERVVELSTLGVKNRIHAELLRRVREHDNESNRVVIESPPTHHELASRVSTHREAVTKAFAELQRAGVIEHKGRSTITVLDVARLAAMVENVRG